MINRELANLLDELEIKVVDIQRYRGPGVTMAIGSMARILRCHGYAHLKMVLMSIAETGSNARELVAPVIWAVSDLIVAHPAWAERATDWFDAFDKVDIGTLRDLVRQNKSAVKPRAAIATLLFGFLKSQMDQPPDQPARLAA
jgi:hypothetical protein